MAALGLAGTACGAQAGSVAPSAHTTQTLQAAAQGTTGAWVRIADPSGANFMFPANTKPTLSTSSGGTTRTYIANAGGNAVASVVIIPTPVALNVKNFIVQYPITLRSQGNAKVTAGAITPLQMHGFKGFQAEVRYDSPPGPSHVYEQREAFQLAKYFVVISAEAFDNRALTPAEITQAKDVNAELLRRMSVG